MGLESHLALKQEESTSTSTSTSTASNSPPEALCPQIKKEGKQKTFCEEKYLSKEGEKAVVTCFTNFCESCCEGASAQCKEDCKHSHVDSSLGVKDPEEIFMNVCFSDKLMTTMAPFCDKFYKRGDVSYKMCQSSFCFDCCSSELKLNDQTDPEVRKCISKCLTSLRAKVASNSSIPIRTSDLKEGEDPDKPQEKADAPKDDSPPKAEESPAEKAPAPVVPKPAAKKVVKKKKPTEKCYDETPNPKIAEDFCKINFDPSSSDERLRDIDKCLKVFCPMCCVRNFEEPPQMMDCQKKCRETIDSNSAQTQKKPEETVNPNANANTNTNSQTSLVENNSKAPNMNSITGTSNSPATMNSFSVPKNNYFDEDELSFLSTICNSFQTESSYLNLDCNGEICIYACKENFGQDKIEECQKICNKGTHIVNQNPFAFKILSYFIGKLRKNRFLQINSEIIPSKTIDEQIEDSKKEILNEKDALLKLERHLLELQRLKKLQLETKEKEVKI